MFTLFLLTAAVLSGAVAFFIHVGKSVERGSYVPFRKKVETLVRRDSTGDFSIIAVLMKLNFDAEGNLPESTVRILRSDPALLYTGIIHFAYLDRYIDGEGYWCFLHAAVERWRHLFYKMFIETFYIDIDDARSLIHEAARNAAVLSRGDDIGSDAVRVLKATVFKGKDVSPEQWETVRNCVRDWAQKYLPEAYTAIDELKKCRKHMDAGKEKNIVASWLNTIYLFNRSELPAMDRPVWGASKEHL